MKGLNMLNKTFLFIFAMTLLGIIGIVTVNLALDSQNQSQVLAAKPPTKTPKPPTPGPGGIGIYSFICPGCDLSGISLPEEGLNNAWLRGADLRAVRGSGDTEK